MTVTPGESDVAYAWRFYTRTPMPYRFTKYDLNLALRFYKAHKELCRLIRWRLGDPRVK